MGDQIFYNGEAVCPTGRCEVPRRGQLYMFTDGTICEASNCINKFPIFQYRDGKRPSAYESDAPFWMIVQEGDSATRVKHYDYDAAYNEIIRLSRDNIGKRFYILKATDMVGCNRPDPEWTEIVGPT